MYTPHQFYRYNKGGAFFIERVCYFELLMIIINGNFPRIVITRQIRPMTQHGQLWAKSLAETANCSKF